MKRPLIVISITLITTFCTPLLYAPWVHIKNNSHVLMTVALEPEDNRIINWTCHIQVMNIEPQEQKTFDANCTSMLYFRVTNKNQYQFHSRFAHSGKTYYLSIEDNPQGGWLVREVDHF